MPYGLFDYTPGSTIHTMGLSPKAGGVITTKAMGEECPTIMPPVCKDGSVPRQTGQRRDSRGCVMPIFAPCPPPKPPKPSCPSGCRPI